MKKKQPPPPQTTSEEEESESEEETPQEPQESEEEITEEELLFFKKIQEKKKKKEEKEKLRKEQERKEKEAKLKLEYEETKTKILNEFLEQEGIIISKENDNFDINTLLIRFYEKLKPYKNTQKKKAQERTKLITANTETEKCERLIFHNVKGFKGYIKPSKCGKQQEHEIIYNGKEYNLCKCCYESWNNNKLKDGLYGSGEKPQLKQEQLIRIINNRKYGEQAKELLNFEEWENKESYLLEEHEITERTEK